MQFANPVLMLQKRDIIPVYYVQEVSDLSGASVKAVETLLRFRTSDGDIVHFSEITADPAELELGKDTRLLFQDAQKAIAKKLFNNDYKYVGFNISPQHLLSDEWVSGAIALCEYVQNNFSHAGIVYEITEMPSADASSESVLLEAIQKLRHYGAQFAIDDFGKLGSSILRLCMLELEYVKFDRSMVIAALNNNFAQNLIRSILAECQKNQITVIAEGVENQEQCSAWQAMNATLQQGFLFGRPSLFKPQPIAL